MSAPQTLAAPGLTSQQRMSVLGMVLVLGLTLMLYHQTAMSMVQVWARSETFAHGFLVLPISLWLVWRQRALLAAQPIQPSLWCLALVFGVTLMWWVGELVAINAMAQLAFVALLILSVPSVLGLAMARQIWFPLLFLLFAVPVGEFLLPLFMAWTADFTVLALRVSGVPVYREGLQFVIPSGNWSVVEACSGIRYLIASVMVGSLFAYLNYDSPRRRALFVGVSIVVPIVANWVRAYMIVMLGHYSNNRLAVGVDHLIYGWIFFGVVMMLMFWIGARWSDPVRGLASTASSSTTAAPLAAVGRVKVGAALFLALAVTPHLLQWAVTERGAPLPLALVAPAMPGSDWPASGVDSMGFKPAFRNPSAEINTGYASQQQTVGLYVAYYQRQSQGRELVSSDNQLLAENETRWVQRDTRGAQVQWADQGVNLRRSELRATGAGGGGAQPLLVWQVYWIHGTLTANDYLAKAYGAYYRLTGQGDNSAVIVIYARNQAGDHAQSLLASFFSDNYGFINDWLSRSGQARPSGS